MASPPWAELIRELIVLGTTRALAAGGVDNAHDQSRAPRPCYGSGRSAIQDSLGCTFASTSNRVVWCTSNGARSTCIV